MIALLRPCEIELTAGEDGPNFGDKRIPKAMAKAKSKRAAKPGSKRRSSAGGPWVAVTQQSVDTWCAECDTYSATHRWLPLRLSVRGVPQLRLRSGVGTLLSVVTLLATATVLALCVAGPIADRLLGLAARSIGLLSEVLLDVLNMCIGAI